MSGCLATKQLKEFTILQVKYLGAKFLLPTKFVDVSELMLQEFYIGVVQYLTKWEPQASKVKPRESALEEEAFIEDVNRGVYVKDPAEQVLHQDITALAGLVSQQTSDG